MTTEEERMTRGTDEEPYPLGQRIRDSHAPHWALTDLTDMGIADATPNEIRTAAWELIDSLIAALDRAYPTGGSGILE